MPDKTEYWCSDCLGGRYGESDVFMGTCAHCGLTRPLWKHVVHGHAKKHSRRKKGAA